MDEKNLKKFLGLTTRVSLVQSLSKTKGFPVSVGAELMSINRTSVYYKGTGVSEQELAYKAIIDRLHTDNPTWGARQMSSQHKMRGFLYLTAIIDWYSRCIVGWELDDTLDT